MAPEFHRLAAVPAEAEWFANIQNKHTRDAYKRDVSSFMRFVSIRRPEDFRTITRAQVIAWRDTLAAKSAATVRRQLSALSSLMDYLCDQNAIAHNPVNGIARPTEGANEGKTPAISDSQARRLLEAPPADTLKGKRDRAIIAILLYHGLRRSELCALRAKDVSESRGVLSFTVRGKRSKIRYLGALTSGAIFSRVVLPYGRELGITVEGFGPHSLRTTAATKALEHDADITKVQDWLGHANVSTTRLYDRRKMMPEDSPTFLGQY